jgi:hypothetical protein
MAVRADIKFSVVVGAKFCGRRSACKMYKPHGQLPKDHDENNMSLVEDQNSNQILVCDGCFAYYANQPTTHLRGEASDHARHGTTIFIILLGDPPPQPDLREHIASVRRDINSGQRDRK